MFAIKPLFMFIVVCMTAVSSYAVTYYISPNGNDSNGGTSCSDAEKTFAALFASKNAGDDYILCSTSTITTYDWQDTGVLSFDIGECANCAQIPSGIEGNFSTVSGQFSTDTYRLVASTYQWKALFIGRSFRKDGWIEIDGLHFEGGGQLYNSSRTWVHNCSFHRVQENNSSVFVIGTNDHANGNTYNLIEDCLIWGEDRTISVNYRADNNIWRRVLMTSDGCASGSCTGVANPNVVYSTYESLYTENQNMIIIDRILDGGEPYGDFATAQHTDTPDTFDNQYNAWRGCLSLNSNDFAYHFEADNAAAPTITMLDCMSVDAKGGFNMGAVSTSSVFQNLTSLNAYGPSTDGFRCIGPTVSTIKNLVISTSARYGFNSDDDGTYINVHNSSTADFNISTCTTGTLTSDPLNDGTPASIKYLPRIETGSALKGTADSGADYGANLLFRYGADGSFSGEASSNTLTASSLWPWPNESKWQTLMCVTSTGPWCASGKTLTNYIWDYLGNTDGPYGSNPPATPVTFESIGEFTINGSVTIQ